MSSLYDLLGVKPTARPATIDRAFRKLARQYHPDRTSGDAEAAAKFQAISEAYEVLRDPERRRHYDQTGEYDTGPDKTPAEVASMLTGVLFTVLSELLTRGEKPRQRNVVQIMRDKLATQRRTLEQQQKTIVADVELLTDLAGRFECDGGVNVLAASVRQRKAGAEQALRQNQQQVEVVGRVEEALKGYRFRVDETGRAKASGIMVTMDVEMLARNMDAWRTAFTS